MFPRGTYNKLKMKNIGPCRILNKLISNNAYMLELSKVLDISSTFSVFNVYEYLEGSTSGRELTINWEY